jgi:hypothetical protein
LRICAAPGALRPYVVFSAAAISVGLKPTFLRIWAAWTGDWAKTSFSTSATCDEL